MGAKSRLRHRSVRKKGPPRAAQVREETPKEGCDTTMRTAAPPHGPCKADASPLLASPVSGADDRTDPRCPVLSRGVRLEIAA